MRNLYILLFYFITIQLYSIEFKYNFSESYRIESIVYQNVKLNRKIQLSSVIQNKYRVEINDTYNDSAELNVTQDVFQESKGLTSGFYTNHQTTKGTIIQYSDGYIDPIDNLIFPAVQNIPLFPNRDVKIGESWTGMAIEYFDLKNGFGIEDYIKTEFRVFYTYHGNKLVDGQEMAIIKMSYNIFEKVKPYIEWGDFYPLKISGGSKQTLLWDIEKGRPHSVDDDFFIEFTTSTGDLYTFNGRTESKSWPKNDLRSKRMLALKETLEITPQTTVDEEEDYLKITFNSMLFDPESDILKDSVKNHLDNIGSALKEIDDINIRIIGHTALFGENDPKYLTNLSTRRARAVAEYLLEMDYLDKNSIEVIGLGGSRPVDTNDTKEGRSRNRRVEIDILKN
ncbi:MAG: OmpA family protein [Spirochaetaceae bacterium]